MLSPTITRAGYWAHMRRKFVDTAPASTTKGQANYAIDLINHFLSLINSSRTYRLSNF